MSRIAIVNIGMHGHVNPTLGFTEELVKRGHTVHYFVDPEFAPAVARTGARPVEYGSQIGQLVQQRAQAQLLGQDPPGSFGSVHPAQRFGEELERTLPQLLSAFDRFRPDVVVYNFISFGGRLAARKMGISAVKFFTTYAANEQVDVLSPMFAKQVPATEEARQTFRHIMDAVCARFGCEPLDTDRIFRLSERANLVFLPRSFQPHGEAFDERFHFVGPCLRSEPHRSLEGILSEGSEPLLFISLGTVHNAWREFYTACLSAFGGGPFRVVMALGAHVTVESLGPLPSNFVVRPHVPQLSVLQRAHVFVSHGGMNSTMEALSFGVPMVVIPQMDEQEATARRIDELALGRFLPRESVSAQSLAAAVNEVAASATVRANVLRMRGEVQQTGGSPRAASVIEGAVPVRRGAAADASAQH